MQRHHAAVRLLFFVFVLALAAGCALTEPYEECGFPPAQEEACVLYKSDSPEIQLKKGASNCVVEQPQCPDNFCVSYHGSNGFCSLACDDDTDCPSGGACKEFAFDCETDAEGNRVCLHLCVKKSLAN
jgi:hypothetical protein